MSISYGGDFITDSDGGKLRPSSAVFRNRIINGAMVIDQRNAGASVTPSATGYTLDRWSALLSVSSKFSVQRNATPTLAGFTNYLAATSLSAYSVGASDQFGIYQPIEGYNVADLNWGTSNAKTITLSFWIYSSLTGTFGGSLRNSATTRSYPFNYSVSVANTWTQISITIAGDTTGTWVNDNGVGIYLTFSLGAGSTYSATAGSWNAGNFTQATGATSVVGTSGATFYITGVQLEVGSSATGFEYRQYGQELALCQRYLPAVAPNTVGYTPTTGAALVVLPFPVSTRVVPTGITLTAAAGTYFTYTGTNIQISPTTVTFDSASTTMGTIACNAAASFVAGQGCRTYGSTILFTGCEL